MAKTSKTQKMWEAMIAGKVPGKKAEAAVKGGKKGGKGKK